MTPAPRSLAATLFFLSGAIALLYELVWTRQMVLLVGASTPAVSVVLGIFMAGLAIGARLFGRVADRHPAPLKLYGLLEVGIGAYALALPSLFDWSTPVYLRLVQWIGGSPAPLALVRIALGVVLLGVPTALMGGSLPALLRAIGRRSSEVGVDLGGLYAANLLGAVAGTIATAFVLISALGVRGVIAFAATSNLAIGLAALLWPVRTVAEPPSLDESLAPADSGGSTSPLPAPLLLGTVFLSGVFTMALEVLWTRILIFSFLSTIYAFAVILATFLCGLALGSSVLAFAERRGRVGAATLGAAQIAAGLSALALAPLGAGVKDMVFALSRAWGFSGFAYVVEMAVGSALLMLVPVILMGVVFPAACRLSIVDLSAAGSAVGRAYWVNTVGAVVGSILAGFVLLPTLGLKASLILLTSLQVVSGWVALLWSAGSSRRRFAWGVGSSLALAAAVFIATRSLAGPNPFDRVPGTTVLAYHDDPAASVSVLALPSGGRSLRIDGFDAATAEPRSGYMSMMAHIPMLLHPQPKRVLVICFGTGTTAGAVLRHAGATMDVVDLNPTVFAFADYFRDVNHGVAQDPRAQLRVDDGRSFLATTPETYDVITSEPMPPTFAGVVNLYSREYYERARGRLRPGGFVVQWLPFHLVSTSEAWSILRSVHEVFPQTTLWMHDDTGIIVACRDHAVTIDLPVLRQRVVAMGEELRRFGVRDAADFADLHALGPSAVAELTRGALAVTDDRPSLEFHPLRHPASRHLGGVLTPDQMRALLAVYALRLREPLPLTNTAADEEQAIAARHVTSGHALLGDTYMGAGERDLARREYEQGLVTATAPRERALFFFALGQIEEQQARIPEALAWLDRGLALWPDNGAAQRRRAALAGKEP